MPITDVPIGYEGYYVSNKGRIRSSDKLGGHRWGGTALKRGKILTSKFDKDGYIFTILYHKSKPLVLKVHRLVAKYFLPVSDGTEVNHKDFDKTNNVYTNLEWVTRKENQEHASNAGKFTASSNSKRAKKLTVELAKEIREARESGLTYAALGKKFSIDPVTAFNVVKGQIWN